MHLGGGGVSLLEVSGLIEDEIFEEEGLILFDSFSNRIFEVRGWRESESVVMDLTDRVGRWKRKMVNVRRTFNNRFHKL